MDKPITKAMDVLCRVKSEDSMLEEWQRLIHATKKMTPIEAIAFCVLDAFRSSNGLSLEPQKGIGKYFVDFLITDPANNLRGKIGKGIVFECDGHEFHERTKEQAQKDKSRERYLLTQGYVVIRFTGSEIWRSSGRIIAEHIFSHFQDDYALDIWNRFLVEG